jgi:hypothetical protein
MGLFVSGGIQCFYFWSTDKLFPSVWFWGTYKVWAGTGRTCKTGHHLIFSLCNLVRLFFSFDWEVFLLGKKIVSICATLGEDPIIRYHRPLNDETGAPSNKSLPYKLAMTVQREVDNFCRVNPNFPVGYRYIPLCLFHSEQFMISHYWNIVYFWPPASSAATAAACYACHLR